MVRAEQRVRELGLEIPDYSNPPFGRRYGKMKPFHLSGKTLTLGGMTPENREGVKVFPGRVGATITAEEGYQAARATAINTLGLIRAAVGSLDRVASFVSILGFVVVSEDFTDVHAAANGANDLFIEVFGEEIGIGTYAAIGVMNLSGGNCFEIWTTVELG